MASNAPDSEPTKAVDAVLVQSQPMPEGSVKVKGIDFDHYAGKSITVDELVRNMSNMGFQASSLGKAIEIVDKMRSWKDPADPSKRPTIFLGYTSNLISSGLRETIRYLVQHKHVAAIVTTAGGVEEDFIKCLAPTYMGAFHLDGATLRKSGMNRIGNLVVPNNNYCKFEDWVVPILDKMLEEQETSRSLPPDEHLHWTPSKVIHRLGKEIDNEESVYYWAYKNDIPVFCPALTDGSLGDMLFFHTFKSSPAMLRIDIVEDIRRINSIAMNAACTGIIVLGGGVVKHHIANANLMRNGAEYAVFINTANEFDGSDAGARPDEAVSWGKIKIGGEAVKVYAEATLVFPLIVAATFAKGTEYGGQILRASAVLSALLDQPLYVEHVRGNRAGRGNTKGGLRAQHIACLETLAKWSAFNTGRLKRDDKEVSFLPRKRTKTTKSYRYWSEETIPDQQNPKRTATVNISGVGSVLLLIQAILPWILYNGPKEGEPETPLHLTVTGGTHVSKAPTLEYFTQVFAPMMAKLGYPEIKVHEKSKGWSTGPTIPGEVEFVIPSIPAGKTMPGFTMEDPGEVVGYDVTFIVPEDARRSFRVTTERWFEEWAPGVEMNIVKDETSGHLTRFYLLVVAKTRNGYLLGRDWIWDRKNKRADGVSADMVRKVWGWLQKEVDNGGCVDHYLQDQLVVYQILAEGDSMVDGGRWDPEERRDEEDGSSEVDEERWGQGSLHTKTVRWVGTEIAETKWSTKDGGEGAPQHICKGVGLLSSTGEGWE